MITMWNYKGLACKITKTETGYIYEVSEVGLITKQPHWFIYGGSKIEITKKDVEYKIDTKLKEDKINLSNQCPHLLDSYVKNSCAFTKVCDVPCIIKADNISKLENTIASLANVLDDPIKTIEETIGRISDIIDEYYYEH